MIETKFDACLKIDRIVDSVFGNLNQTELSLKLFHFKSNRKLAARKYLKKVKNMVIIPKYKIQSSFYQNLLKIIASDFASAINL